MRSIMKNLFTSHMRNPTAEEDYIFYMQSILGDGLKDSITGVPAIISISGTRYGIVNGVVTQFPVNQPPIEDDGLRGCPAFTQMCPNSGSLDLWNTVGNVTTINGYVTKTDNNNGWIMVVMPIPIQNTGQMVVFASIELIGTGSVGINMVVDGGAAPIADLIDTLTGQIYPAVVLDPVIHKKIIVRGVIAESDRTSLTMRIRSLSDPFSFKILGRGAQVTISNTEMPYVPNNTIGSISVVSEAATATSGTSFDLDNTLLARLKTALRGPNAQGHLELTFKSNFDSGWFPSASVTSTTLFTSNNSDFSGALRFRSSEGITDLRMTDPNNNYAYVQTSVTVGQIFKISLDWGTHSTGQKMRLTVNGVKSALANFSGSFGAQDLRFFFGNTVHVGWIVKDSFKIMDKPIW